MYAAVMRRALEYARTFDLPVIQHAEDHDLTAGAQMHEGAVSTRLGPPRLAARRRGHHRRARRAPRRAHRRALPRRPRLDAGRGAHPARGQVARARGHAPRSRRTTSCSPTQRSRLRHRLQGQPAAARAGGRRGAARRRSPTARSTASRPTTRRTRRSRRTASSRAASPGMIGLELCRAAAARPGPRWACSRRCAWSTLLTRSPHASAGSPRGTLARRQRRGPRGHRPEPRWTVSAELASSRSEQEHAVPGQRGPGQGRC